MRVRSAREKKFPCPECGKLFTDNHKIKKHLPSHKRDLKPKPPSPIINMPMLSTENQNMKSLDCHLCGKIMSTKNILQRHMKMHDHTRPMALDEELEVANKPLVIDTEIQILDTVENNVPNSCEPFERPSLICSCPLCGKHLRDKWALKRHMHFHTFTSNNVNEETYKRYQNNQEEPMEITLQEQPHVFQAEQNFGANELLNSEDLFDPTNIENEIEYLQNQANKSTTSSKSKILKENSFTCNICSMKSATLNEHDDHMSIAHNSMMEDTSEPEHTQTERQSFTPSLKEAVGLASIFHTTQNIQPVILETQPNENVNLQNTQNSQNLSWSTQTPVTVQAFQSETTQSFCTPIIQTVPMQTQILQNVILPPQSIQIMPLQSFPTFSLQYLPVQNLQNVLNEAEVKRGLEKQLLKESQKESKEEVTLESSDEESSSNKGTYLLSKIPTETQQNPPTCESETVNDYLTTPSSWTDNKKCHICGKIFQSPHNVRRHLETHSIGLPYKCRDCGHLFKSKDNVARHVRRAHLRQPYPREIVPTKDSNQSESNIRSVSPDLHPRPYKCKQCGNRFKDKDCVNAHVRKVHKSSLLLKDWVLDPEKTFKSGTSPIPPSTAASATSVPFPTTITASRSLSPSEDHLQHGSDAFIGSSASIPYSNTNSFTRLSTVSPTIPLLVELDEPSQSTFQNPRPFKCNQCNSFLKNKKGIYDHFRKVHKMQAALADWTYCEKSPQTAAPSRPSTPESPAPSPSFPTTASDAYSAQDLETTYHVKAPSAFTPYSRFAPDASTSWNRAPSAPVLVELDAPPQPPTSPAILAKLAEMNKIMKKIQDLAEL